MDSVYLEKGLSKTFFNEKLYGGEIGPVVLNVPLGMGSLTLLFEKLLISQVVRS